MKAFAPKPRSGLRGGDRRDWLHGAAAMAVGAALAYGGLYLFTLFRPESTKPEAHEPTLPGIPAEKAQALPAAMPAPAPGEDPWWRGDAAFWREQARLNAAVVAPQYREVQIAWAEKMAATAEQRAKRPDAASEPLALPARDAHTTELSIPDRQSR